jgi:hypothetical protein
MLKPLVRDKDGFVHIDAWEQYEKGPGISYRAQKHDVNDPRTWGSVCGRGFQYASTGAPSPTGTKAVVRKISTGRKSRGMASGKF